jgi:hypothetical protein
VAHHAGLLEEQRAVIARASITLLLVAALAGSALADVAPDLKPETRIQRRFVEKKGRLAAYAGFAYLGRGDFYHSPGIEAAVSYYILESLAADLRGAYFFSYASDELKDVAARTGYVPDSHPSKASVLLGARLSIGYAKIRITSHLVVHFEPQLFLYGGIHVTPGLNSSTLVAPMGEIGIGFLVYPTPHIQARIDAGLTVGGEQRTTYVTVVGGFPVLSVGVLF